MAAKPSGKGRGRPRKRPESETRQRVPLSLTVSRRVNHELRAAAGLHGRSISQEAERRLEQSFQKQALIGEVLELAFGRRIAGLVLMLGEAMDACLETFGMLDAQVSGLAPSLEGNESWLKDPYAYAILVRAVTIMLERHAPKSDGPLTPTPSIAEAMVKTNTSDPAQFVTTPLLAALRGRIQGDNSATRWATQTRELLGDIDTLPPSPFRIPEGR